MTVNETARPARRTLSEHARIRFKGVLDPFARLLLGLGLMPNTITLAGLAGNAIGALFLARGNFLVGGLLVLIMGPIDALDGAMARLADRATRRSSVGGLPQTSYLRRPLVPVVAAGGDDVSATSRRRLHAVSCVKRARVRSFEAKGGMLTRFELPDPGASLSYSPVGVRRQPDRDRASSILAVIHGPSAIRRPANPPARRISLHRPSFQRTPS
jgi:hypothetical protein